MQWLQDELRVVQRLFGLQNVYVHVTSFAPGPYDERAAAAGDPVAAADRPDNCRDYWRPYDKCPDYERPDDERTDDERNDDERSDNRIDRIDDNNSSDDHRITNHNRLDDLNHRRNSAVDLNCYADELIRPHNGVLHHSPFVLRPNGTATWPSAHFCGVIAASSRRRCHRCYRCYCRPLKSGQLPFSLYKRDH